MKRNNREKSAPQSLITFAKSEGRDGRVEQNKFDADLNSELGARLTNVKSPSEDETLRESKKKSTLSYGQQAPGDKSAQFQTN